MLLHIHFTAKPAKFERRSAARQNKAGMLNCELGMGKPFDIELERLTGRTSYSEVIPGVAAGQRGTFFLETFGCQMNDHDSEKVAGLLLSRGYQQVETPEAASLILYNTCSIREKAAQKVFSRLGEYREKQSEGKAAVIVQPRTGAVRSRDSSPALNGSSRVRALTRRPRIRMS